MSVLSLLCLPSFEQVFTENVFLGKVLPKHLDQSTFRFWSWGSPCSFANTIRTCPKSLVLGHGPVFQHLLAWNLHMRVVPNLFVFPLCDRMCGDLLPVAGFSWFTLSCSGICCPCNNIIKSSHKLPHGTQRATFDWKGRKPSLIWDCPSSVPHLVPQIEIDHLPWCRLHFVIFYLQKC